jgi:mRNA interferase RelE/StbE
MSAWRLEWTPQAVKDLARLESDVARRVLAKLDAASEDPARFFERLTDSPSAKLRVGDYRVLALVLRGERAILVQRVRHRSNLYSQ